MWKFIQVTVLSLVVASNIQWHWTPNGLLAGMIGGVTAFGVTSALSKVSDLLLVWRSKRAGKRPSSNWRAEFVNGKRPGVRPK